MEENLVSLSIGADGMETGTFTKMGCAKSSEHRLF